jgi:hypothetical protein
VFGFVYVNESGEEENYQLIHYLKMFQDLNIQIWWFSELMQAEGFNETKNHSTKRNILKVSRLWYSQQWLFEITCLKSTVKDNESEALKYYKLSTSVGDSNGIVSYH